MTDISITAANVKMGTGAVLGQGIFGATITQGQVVYREASTGLYKLADSNGATAEVKGANGVSIALNSGGADQPGTVQKLGEITVGGTLTPGVAYYLSDTPGGICPIEDVGTGETVLQLGVAKSATVLILNPVYTGVAN